MATTQKRKAAAPKASNKQNHARRTVRSSNRVRAARAGVSDNVVAGRRKPKPSVIDAESDSEIYGVQLSERARRGESNPRMPESKIKPTQTREPKKVPRTGAAKSRKAPK